MMQKPNFLIIHTDQQRWDTINALGNPVMHTPNLDRLVRDGVGFHQAYCNNPVCMPSRHSLLSGQYPSCIGTTCNGIEMREDIPILPDYLKPAGYHTANIGKLHFLNHSSRDYDVPHPDYRFDTLVLSDEPGCYEDDYIKWVRENGPEFLEKCRCSTPPAWQGKALRLEPRDTHEPYVFRGPEQFSHSAFVASKSIEFLQKQINSDRPFCLISGFYAPHPPLNPPERFLEYYPLDHMELPKRGNKPDPFNLPDRQWQKIRRYYYDLISHVDHEIGRILSALDELMLTNRTIIMFLSDHGEYLGDHGMIQKGPPGYDACIHIPLICSGVSRFPGGRTSDVLIEAVDILPTICDLAEIDVHPRLQGRSFANLLFEQEYQPRNSVFMEMKIPFQNSWKTVRTRSWKYSLAADGDELLFDLINDPAELTNLAADAAYADQRSKMRLLLLQRWFDTESQYPEKTGEY